MRGYRSAGFPNGSLTKTKVGSMYKFSHILKQDLFSDDKVNSNEHNIQTFLVRMENTLYK